MYRSLEIYTNNIKKYIFRQICICEFLLRVVDKQILINFSQNSLFWVDGYWIKIIKKIITTFTRNPFIYG